LAVARLDHAHGFYEGNSRTLREFTRELAEEAGFTFDWTKTGVTAKERNELYLARDLAVYEREFPGLNEDKAMQTDDRREYEAYFTLEYLQKAAGDRTLEAIIGEGLSAGKQLERGGEQEAERRRI
jgi:cell filamentation protein